jgi:VanZ family protein
MVAIFTVSSLSHPEIAGETPDYILHALEYFLLTLLLIRLLLSRQFPHFLKRSGRSFTNWQYACLLGVIIAVGYGISDEIHQYFVPGRHCSLYDVFSDTAGALLAYIVASFDYLLLTNCRSWITFLKRFETISSISYAMYRFK